MQRDARHRRRATERQRDFVSPGIARLDVRPRIVFVLMHDRPGVIVRGESMVMFRVIVSDVRVRVQPGQLARSGQQGDSHDER